MSASDNSFVGPIPDLYDRLFVPLIFETYADDLADRVAKLAPGDVLELAAGTGALTRAMAVRLPPDVSIRATDINQPMLDRAQARQASDTRITFAQSDAMELSSADAAFDVVACQFGVMFFPEKVRAYSEARRVLRPDGHLLFNVWDTLAFNDFAATVTEALATLFPEDPPLFMARIPHGYNDTAHIRGELTAAGFGSVSIETISRRSHGRSAREVALTYCQGTPLRAEIEARRPGGLEQATDHATAVLERRFGSGPIEGAIQAIIVGAVA